MKTATLTETKNRLSALIDQVRHGETILILDRGRAVARLTSVLAEESSAPEGRVERLERQGILHRAQARKSPHLFHRPRPVPSEGGSILEALLEERRSGR
jgi:prevent-host-death family protein